MTATLTLDESGRLILPESAVQVLGLKPGDAVQAEVTRRNIELLDAEQTDAPLITEFTADGLPVIPASVRSGLSIVEAIKADRAARDRKLARR